MARPLRIEYAGAHYHVMNRGNGRQVVFTATRDYELFLERLGQFGQQFEVGLLCYCCLPNHFHLYLRTEQANLSRFMQSLLTSFTISLNRCRRSSGHLFQGRFTAHPVENEAYGGEVSRCLHLNPVRTQVLRQASVSARRRALRAFGWSSYAACIGLAAGPKWFDPGPLLSDWGAGRWNQGEKKGAASRTRSLHPSSLTVFSVPYSPQHSSSRTLRVRPHHGITPGPLVYGGNYVFLQAIPAFLSEERAQVQKKSENCSWDGRSPCVW